ncbi:hypothetical protein V8F33_001004 [Rhypophila sp. PSN 637]
MAPGEPTSAVKRRIANMYSGRNRYSTLKDDESVSSDDNDTGGGAPLYSPVEDTFNGASSRDETALEGSGNLGSTHADASNASDDNSAREKDSQRSDFNRAQAQVHNGWRAQNSNMQASYLGNKYGSGSSNNSAAGRDMVVGSQPVMYQMPQHFQGMTATASNGPPNMSNMYPQYATNGAIPQYPVMNQQQNHYPVSALQQQQYGQGYAYNQADGSPAPTTVINTEMTPKAAATSGSEYETPTKTGSYVQSEPRNFAPRPNGGFIQPPPQFNLPGLTAPVKETEAPVSGSDDPFGASSPSKERGALRLLPAVMEADESRAVAIVPSSAGPVRPEIQALRSAHLNRLTDTPSGLPTIEEALSRANFPFIESSIQSSPSSNGVILLKNIPFASKRAEIIALLGRNAKILNDTLEPVHIIMERTTSKTLDAYVEFVSSHEAMKAVERLGHAQTRGRLPRLGDRPVEVTLSSPTQLMTDLFPLATGVMWRGSYPHIQESGADEPWKTFKGFVTEEEMTMLVKHVEIPHRSPYSKECPQRPYECMISTIKKLPWQMSDKITIRQRWAVYNATYRLLELMMLSIRRHHELQLSQGRPPIQHDTINEQLQKRLLRAAMLCPGFTVLQKDNIAYLVNMSDQQQRGFNQPRFPEMWIHEQAICPKPGVPLDVLEWYIAIIRDETTRSVNDTDLTERTRIQEVAGKLSTNYFGFLWYEIGYPDGPEFDQMTLHEAAMKELSAIERILKRALPYKH